jgi:chromate reductase
VSVGGTGGFGANHHLRQSLVFLDMPTLQQPEAYFGHAGTFFDAEGNLANEGTKKVMQAFIHAYAAWVERIVGGTGR